MALTNAEKQAAFRARRDQRITVLEKQNAELRAEVERLRDQSAPIPAGAPYGYAFVPWPNSEGDNERAPTKELSDFIEKLNGWLYAGEDFDVAGWLWFYVESLERWEEIDAEVRSQFGDPDLAALPADKLVAGLQRIIKGLRDEGKKHAAAASPDTVARFAHDLEVLLYSHEVIPKSPLYRRLGKAHGKATRDLVT
jgi:hypothetical protein